MENKGKKRKIVMTAKTQWIIFISVLMIALISSLILYFVTLQNNAVEVSSKESIQESNKTVEDTANIEDFSEVANKTEEELKEINEKELKEAEKKEENKNKQTTTNSKKKYYIKVNYGAQVVNVYTYDKNGEYTVPVKAFVCSTGTETPRSGVYKIPAKIEWCFMFGDVYAHYCTQIVGNILFHSVPYLKKSNDTLEYWAYDQLGTKASMGCIRLTTRDAKWIYDNVSYGTSVEFYSSSNPGPLGKPTAQKISNAPGNLKWWDPTDPDSRNPWRTYKPSEEKNEEKNEQTNTEETNTNQEVNNNQVGNNEQNNTQSENNQIENNEQNNTQDNEQSNTTQNGNKEEGNNNQETENTTQNNTSNETEGNNQTNETDGTNQDTENNQIIENDKTDIVETQ